MKERRGIYQKIPGQYYESHTFSWPSDWFDYFCELAEANCHELTGVQIYDEYNSKGDYRVVLQDLYYPDSGGIYFTGIHEILVQGEPSPSLYKVESLHLRHWTGDGGFVPEIMEYYADRHPAEARSHQLKLQKSLECHEVIENDFYLNGYFPEIDQLFSIQKEYYYDYDGYFVSFAGPLPIDTQ